MDYHSVPTMSMSEGTQLGFKLQGNAGSLVMNDNHYTAKAVTFHTPSEHTIGGMPAEMEMQIRHIEKKTNRTAIVSIMFQKGRNNTVMGPVFEAMKKMGAPTLYKGKRKGKREGKARGMPKGSMPLGPLDLLDVIPFDPGFVIYPGSLTTPPCTENVLWIIVDKKIEVSLEQINVIRNIVGDNARPVQERNGRVVKRIAISATGTMASMSSRFLERIEQMAKEAL